MEIDAKKLWTEVKENLGRLDHCPKHRFEGGYPALGANMTCLQCGGSLNIIRVRYYIQGYMAAGGKSDDIWPGYEQNRPKARG